MIRYYAARVHDSVDGQRDTVMVQETHPTYDTAMEVHARRIAYETPRPFNLTTGQPEPRPQHWRDTVLLDLGSITYLDPDEVGRLIATDPMLRAIFELGRQHELVNSINRRDARYETPECCASGSCEVCKPGSGWSS